MLSVKSQPALDEKAEAAGIGEAVTTRLLEALAELWESVRAEHTEVPAVILATGPHRPRRGARSILGCFSHLAWEPANPGPSELTAIDDDELRAAIERGDAEAAIRRMRLNAEAFMRELMQLRFDASLLRGEVFITDEILARGARDIEPVLPGPPRRE